jgi:hypothetical protein
VVCLTHEYGFFFLLDGYLEKVLMEVVVEVD